MATEDEEFAASFAEHTGGTASPAPAPAAPDPAPADGAAPTPAPAEPAPTDGGAPVPTPTPASPPAAGGGTEGAAAPAPAPAGTPTPAPAPAEPTPAPAPAAPPADWQAQIDALRAELAAAKATPAPAPAPAAEPAPAPAPAPIYTPDEEAQIAKYMDEWGDVAKGEALVRRAEYNHLLGYVFDQIRPHLTQLRETLERHGEQLMYSDLTSVIPDYDDVRDQVLAWIDTQPAILQPAYRKVADEGSAEDVAQLVEIWRKANPAPAPAPAAGAPAAGAPAAPAPAPAPNPAAIAALKPVNTGRTTHTGGPDPNDYDGAFAEFAKL